MRRAIYPGSFDPVTNGHLDIMGRAAGLFDEIVVAVLVNKTKRSLFGVDERIAMLEEVTAPFGNVTVGSFHGLLVDPPYATPDAEVARWLAAAHAHGWLAGDAVVVVERPRGEAFPWPDPLVAVRERRYGDTVLHTGRVASGP